ncbi:hypothetical protein MTR67_026405 [Solanum verrucosum]|uniref:Ubiquitin-like domain-containing protein n=1 Tax=Solanum verrucosum TaxID=315347 RepID=A0AAF0R274_SOLVR|nr:hypothetical protein MTR67_026405 [Solanum verrucosum]
MVRKPHPSSFGLKPNHPNKSQMSGVERNLEKMVSNGAEDVQICGSGEAECPETTVEIKIKMLDSQTYTLRVDKCVPVPALKEQIATVTGVLTEQQRLICRGKVLKDDQLLSAYHVEDGHTLHLVVRQPSSDSTPDPQATASASSAGYSQGNRVSPGVVVGTYSSSDHGDGIFPDLNRIVTAVLGSFGIASAGGGNEGIDLHAKLSPSVLAFTLISFTFSEFRTTTFTLGEERIYLHARFKSYDISKFSSRSGTWFEWTERSRSVIITPETTYKGAAETAQKVTKFIGVSERGEKTAVIRQHQIKSSFVESNRSNKWQTEAIKGLTPQITPCRITLPGSSIVSEDDVLGRCIVGKLLDMSKKRQL